MLELMVVMVLVALLMMVVVPAINTIAGSDIKNQINQIAGLANELHSRAAIGGISHRINFDLDNQTYWVEKKVGDAGTFAPELGYKELMEVLIKKDNKDKNDNDFMAKFTEVEGEKFTLAKNLVFHGAWASPMKEIARTGIVSMYFYDDGDNDPSFISIAKKGDEEDSAMYFEPNPLTGAATIDFGEPDINTLKNPDGGEQD